MNFVKSAQKSASAAAAKATGADKLQDRVNVLEKENANLKRDVAAKRKALEKAQLALAREREQSTQQALALEDVREDLAEALAELGRIDDAEASAAAAASAERAAEAKAAAEAGAADKERHARALADAQACYDAVKGLNTDEDALIAAICHRSNDDIQYLQQVYLSQYGKELSKRVRKNTDGLFRTLLMGLFQTPAAYRAALLKHALGGLSTNDQVSERARECVCTCAARAWCVGTC